nr:DUF1638 domain-containing protein [uncultured Desulfobacter sp.]
MEAPDTKKITVLACSIFRREIEALIDTGELIVDAHYINSMMHMRPEKLSTVLDAATKRMTQDGKKIVLMFGECHNRMDKYHSRIDVQRVKGCNCVEIILGKERYATLLKEGAFFLMPEWIGRWKEIFNDELGLKGDIGKEFMQEMHKFFLYVDTGLAPVPEQTLNEISQTLGLPWKSIRTDMTHLLGAVQTALETFNS